MQPKATAQLIRQPALLSVLPQRAPPRRSVIAPAPSVARRAFSRGRGHLGVVAASGSGDGQSGGSGEDVVPPSTESLFMKELRRRGVSSSDSSIDEADVAQGAAGTSSSSSSSSTGSSPFSIKGVSSDPFGGARTGGKAESATDAAALEDQLEKSRKLNSEGLEGLIPRATELLKLGGGQFLAFLPFMGAAVALFVGCFYLLGPSFVHGGTDASRPPPYVDPQLLLDEPTYDPMVPLR